MCVGGAWQTLSLNPTLYLEFLAWKAENNILGIQGPCCYSMDSAYHSQPCPPSFSAQTLAPARMIDTWTSVGPHTFYIHFLDHLQTPELSSLWMLGGQLVPLSVNFYIVLGTCCLELAVDYYRQVYYPVRCLQDPGRWLTQSNADCSENCGDLQSAGSDIAPLQAQKAVFMLSFRSAVVRLSSFQEQLDI